MHHAHTTQVKTTSGTPPGPDGKSQAEITTEKFGLEAGLYQVGSGGQEDWN
jgi:hypothetical protein